MMRLSVYLSLIVSVLCSLLQPVSLNAQKFTYASVDKDSYADDISYLIGSDGSNSIVWLYNNRNHILQATLYDNDMAVVGQKDFHFLGSDELVQLNFIGKNTGRNVVIQYKSGTKFITRFYSFSQSENAIIPGQVLEETDVFAGMITLPSANSIYTGLLKEYLTTQDSVLIRYSLYDRNRKLVYNCDLILPRAGQQLFLEDALVDNAGNLYFYSITTRDKPSDAINLYEINIKKDSLITNEISRNGSFSGIRMKQSSIADNVIITGIFSQTGNAPAATGSGYIFLQRVSENLSPQSSMMLIPLPAALSVPQFASLDLKKLDFLEVKDSSYLFYADGFTHTGTVTHTGRLPTVSTLGGSEGRIPFQTIPPFQAAQPFSLYTNAVSDAFNQYTMLPIGSPVYDEARNGYFSGPAGSSVTGTLLDNVFLTTAVTDTKQFTSHFFTDSTLTGSKPEFGFAANTGRNVQYIYSRILKNKKRVIYNVIARLNEPIEQHPLIPKSNYRILLNEGVQVSPDAVVFPYLDVKKVGFVKLNLK